MISGESVCLRCGDADSASTATAGDVIHLFRVVDVTFLANGGLAIANSGSGQILLADEDGAIKRVIGRMGEGPGEFKRLASVRELSDESIAGFDQGDFKIQIYDATARLMREIPLPVREGVVSEVWWESMDSDFWLAAAQRRVDMRAPPGVSRPVTALVQVTGSGLIRDTIVTFPGHAGIRSVTYGFLNQPFGARSFLALWRGRVVLGTGEHREVRVLNAQGADSILLRWSDYDRVVGAKAKADFLSSVAEIGESELAIARRLLDEVPIPSKTPSSWRIVTDPEGYLWVQDYPGPAAGLPGYNSTGERWNIFDESGLWLGSLNLPVGFRLMDVGTTMVVGVSRDTMNVEHVFLYHLDRGNV